LSRRYIQCDRDKCTGCLVCELACSALKEGRFDLQRSRIRVLHWSASDVSVTACQFCRNTPCVKACPRDALGLDEITHTVSLDKARCTGCGWCIEACPFGAIVLDDSTKTVLMCDLCPDRDQPACVEFCPQQALTIHTSQRPE
jgi:carbon-monoxide dehydrogenase iron sulfur subunit